MNYLHGMENLGKIVAFIQSRISPHFMHLNDHYFAQKGRKISSYPFMWINFTSLHPVVMRCLIIIPLIYA